MHPAEQYAQDVLDGKIIACKWVKLACQRYFDDLEHGEERGIYFDRDAAQHRIDFYQFCKHSKGEWAGQVLKAEPWQQFIDWNIFGWKNKNGTRRFRTAYTAVARKNGKALDVDTPIATPTGWKLHGDLVPGDSVFAPNGKIIKVIASTDAYEGPCYAVRFSDGSEIIAHENHEWDTLRTAHTGNKKSDKGRVLRPISTIEIKNTLTHGARGDLTHSIKTTLPIDTEMADLSIDPYFLGVWLGDGLKDGTRISCGSEDIEYMVQKIKSLGYSAIERKTNSAYLISVGEYDDKTNVKWGGLLSKFKAFGLQGNKHIPVIYMRASINQRMELLRGLMDTDGYVSKTGQCEFVQVKEDLFYQVVELLVSLGYKPTVSIDRARVNRKDCGPRYRVQFYSFKDNPAFSIPRKVARLKDKPEGNYRSRTRQITSVEPVGDRLVNCIEVEGGRYLAGERMIPTHNSTQLAVTGLYLAFFDSEPGAEVYTAATKYDQACIIHSESTRMVKASPSLRGLVNVFKNTLTREDCNQKYVPLGQDSNTSDGLNVHSALIDEYHAHPDSGMYDVLKTGMGSRRQPLMYIITTAGFEKEYPCFEMEARIKRILEGSETDDTVFGLIYSLDQDDDWTDSSLWIKANPNLEVSKYLNTMEDDFKEAFSMPSKQNNFKTKHLNVWTEAQTRWITQDVWAKNNSPVDADGLAGRRCWAGLDLSTTTDLSAWVLCFPPEGKGDKYQFLYRFFLPQDNMRERELREKVNYSVWIRNGLITATPGNVIDYEFIKHQILEDAKKYSIEEVNFDPYNSTGLITDIMQEDINCVEFRQGFLSMSPACKEFERKVLGGELATGGNPVMNWMIACTETVSDPAGNIKLVKPERGKTGRHIDGVVASVMGFWRAVQATETHSAYEDRGLLTL